MPEVHGNTEGLRASLLSEMQSLYEFAFDPDLYLDPDLARWVSAISFKCNREISLYISRDGEVVDITVGDNATVPLPSIRLSRSLTRLSRVRCIHTHPHASGLLSDPDLTAMRSLWLDSICALGINAQGGIDTVQAAFPGELSKGTPSIRLTELISFGRIPQSGWMNEILQSDKLVRTGVLKAAEQVHEQVLLLGMKDEADLDELQSLAESAGACVVGRTVQKRDKPDNAYGVGKGKAEEIALMGQSLEADTLLTDFELSGIQIRNLEAVTGLKVIDRTNLILDIFAQHAVSSEGKVQVALAQARYRSTHLLNQGMSLSRLAGGIGTRGPGETKLEMDRRRIREEITRLKKELKSLEQQRALRRNSRKRSEVLSAALVGYTNTGKSSLLNALTGAEVLVKDQLFATLDAVSRKLTLPGYGDIILTDTVGFVCNLPTELVQAFRSTLEEAVNADILILVHDASSPDVFQQRETVLQVLNELGAVNQPRIEVLNKCDLTDDPSLFHHLNMVRMSVRTGMGIQNLLQALCKEAGRYRQTISLLIPFDKMNLLSEIRASGYIKTEIYTDEGAQIEAMLDETAYSRLYARFPFLFKESDT